jgi:hypothetical protein
MSINQHELLDLPVGSIVSFVGPLDGVDTRQLLVRTGEMYYNEFLNITVPGELDADEVSILRDLRVESIYVNPEGRPSGIVDPVVDLDESVVYRSASSGRVVSQAERVAAAGARVVADRKRGMETPAWIVELSGKDKKE